MSVGRITVAEIAAHLSIGRKAVYMMLEKRIIPAIRLGRRWVVTRHAFERFEQSCGSLDQEGGAAQETH